MATPVIPLAELSGEGRSDRTITTVPDKISDVSNFVYVNHIISRGRHDDRYKRLAGFLRDSKTFRAAILTTDLNNSVSIIDFTDSNSSTKTFPVLQSQQILICQALTTVPNDIRTRIVILKDSKRDLFAAAEIIEVLGLTYDVDPEIFRSMAELSQLRKASKTHNVADYMPWERPLQPSFVELGYNTIPDKSEGPRLWVTVRRGVSVGGVALNLVLVRFTPSHQNRDDMREEELDCYSQLSLKPPAQLTTSQPSLVSTSTQLGYCLNMLTSFNAAQIQASNKDPLSFISPFLSLFQAYFSRHMHQLRKTHWEWLHHELGGPSITQTERDNLIFEIWNTSRSILEDFSLLTEQLQTYITELNQDQIPASLETRPMARVLEKHQTMLTQSRTLELHVRDTIQLNVSSLSLRESRKSIERADSVGRITFLAFIFLPLSLITSFFGMNIQELTGSGFTWKVFGASVAVVCTVTAMICLWMWRVRWKVFAWVLYAPFMVPLAIVQFVCAVGVEFWSGRVKDIWSGPMGNLVLDWWTLRPFG